MTRARTTTKKQTSDTCGTGFYAKWVDCTCHPCHVICKECDWSGSGSCTLCGPDDYIPLKSGWNGYKICHGCPLKSHWRNIDTGVCSPCHASCLQCWGPGVGQCAACAPGKTLISMGYCLKSCATNIGWFMDESGRGSGDVDYANGYESDPTGFMGCKKCHSTCNTCYGTTEFDCTSCVSGFMVSGGKCVPGNDSCQVWPSYIDHTTRSC
jgi:hypothetical protein